AARFPAAAVDVEDDVVDLFVGRRLAHLGSDALVRHQPTVGVEPSAAVHQRADDRDQRRPSAGAREGVAVRAATGADELARAGARRRGDYAIEPRRYPP